MQRFASRRRLNEYAAATLLTVFTALSILALPASARAEGRIRIADQYGIVYLLLNVARDQHLIEKQGKAQGLDIQVEWTKLSGGSAVNEAVLSGAVDIGAAGVGPLLTLWDKTYGRQNVRGVASLGDFPFYLVSIDPKVKTIADFTDHDRIALPAVSVSMQSRVLQMASAKRWGIKQYDKLDPITVTLPHPDAAAAIISGGTEITGHFGSPPFQEQELAGNPKAHVVLSFYDVMGGPSTSTALFTTEKFRNENPKTYAAFLAALTEAGAFVKAHPDQAADTYIRVNKSKIDRNFLVKLISDPQVRFTLVPQNTFALAQFMNQAGAIRHKPQSWKDYFFSSAATAQGS